MFFKKSHETEKRLTHKLSVTLPLVKLVDLVRSSASLQILYHCNSKQVIRCSQNTPAVPTNLFPPPNLKQVFIQ